MRKLTCTHPTLHPGEEYDCPWCHADELRAKLAEAEHKLDKCRDLRNEVISKLAEAEAKLSKGSQAAAHWWVEMDTELKALREVERAARDFERECSLNSKDQQLQILRIELAAVDALRTGKL